MSYTPQTHASDGIPHSDQCRGPRPAASLTLSRMTAYHAATLARDSTTTQPSGPSRLGGASRTAAKGGYRNGNGPAGSSRSYSGSSLTTHRPTLYQSR